MVRLSQIAVLLVAYSAATMAFSTGKNQNWNVQKQSTTQLFDGNGTGGWGIGGSRQMVPEEFARSDRAHFDGYKMTGQGDFRRQIQEDKEMFKKSELEELLGVARIAGLKIRDPKERLNKFDPGMIDDDDDLDLSV